MRHSFISTPTVGAFSRCCNNSHPDHHFHVCRTTWGQKRYLRHSAQKQAECRNSNTASALGVRWLRTEDAPLRFSSSVGGCAHSIGIRRLASEAKHLFSQSFP